MGLFILAIGLLLDPVLSFLFGLGQLHFVGIIVIGIGCVLILFRR